MVLLMFLCTLIVVSIFIGAAIALVGSVCTILFSILLLIAGIVVRKKTTHKVAGTVMIVIALVLIVLAIILIAEAASILF